MAVLRPDNSVKKFEKSHWRTTPLVVVNLARGAPCDHTGIVEEAVSQEEF